MSSFGDYQDTLINHQTTQISHHTTNHSKLEDIKTKLDTVNTTLSSGIGGLPTALTGSGNLKVSLQELGNEGSERLNVDIGNAVSQLPTALTSEGNLKVSIQEDFTHNLSTSANQTIANNHLSALALLINPAIATATATTIPAKLDTLETSNQLNKGFLEQIEAHIETMSENQSTFQSGDDVVISGGVVLPSALTGSGNLKVCIQELGNEGTERLNVDIGNAVAQLPTALSGSGRLKIENDFDGAVTNGALTALASAINSDKVDVNISSGGFDGAVTNAGLTALNNSIGSNKVNVNISSGGFDGAVTNGALTELASALNSDRLDVNIANGGFSGAVTNAGLTALNNSIGSNKVNVNISSGGFDGAVTNAHLTELGSAINSDRVDVNIANGGFDGAVTNAHLTELGSAINSDRVDVNIANGGFNGAVTNAHLTELGSAINSDRVDVNIANGGFDGAVTNAGLTALNGTIGLNKVNVNISSGGFDGVVSGTVTANLSTTDNNVLDEIQTNGDNIQSKLDTMDSQIDLLEGVNTIKDVLWLDGATISDQSLSDVLDTEGYERIFIYGENAGSISGNSLRIFGSNASAGTYYSVGTLAVQTSDSGRYLIREDTPLHDGPSPRYLKVFNSSGSTQTITKLRAVMSHKLRYV